MKPMTSPKTTERNIIMASDASNDQANIEIDTGCAFCVDKMATIKVIQIKRIINSIAASLPGLSTGRWILRSVVFLDGLADLVQYLGDCGNDPVPA